MSNSNSSLKVTWQLATLVASLIYIAIMVHGYFNMFASTVGSSAVAILIAMSITALAWLLAKLIASNGGVKNAMALFIPLVLISAAGIFNSMMLNTQGEAIFREAVDEADTSFRKLDQESALLLQSADAETVLGKVRNLETAFIQELRNPVNCGHGAAAVRIFSELKNILPQLTILSGNKDCTSMEKVIPLYQEQINDGLKKHPVMLRNQSIYQAKDEIKVIAIKSADDRSRALTAIESGSNLIIHVKPILEKISRDYKNAAQLLKNNLSIEQSRQVKTDLNFDAVRSVGDVAKFPKLILSRLTDVLMYFILIFAICVDWFLVYLMRRTKELDNQDKKTLAEPKNVRSGLSL